MSDEIAASYAHCRRIARRSASSFYYSFLLLPKPKRQAMCALYAFLRRTDDLGDSAAPAAERRGALVDWRHALVECQAGIYADPILPALAHTVRTFSIPLEYLHAVIDGIETDLEPVAYESFDQLEEYCYRVASVVGLACLRIWGSIHPSAERPARQCGIAFQLTNILRDLGEDAARGRVYLPREDMDRFAYRAEDLKAGVH
ncbi:MAG TPA: phytoene/squalene synthase family protein, partial [Pirellulales bacterium]